VLSPSVYAARKFFPKTRTSTSVAIKVTKLKPGTLQFAVRAVKLSAPTTVTLDIRRN